MAENSRKTKPSSSSVSVDSSGGSSVDSPPSSSVDDGRSNTVFGNDRWKWSKTRKISLWMKNSVRDAIPQELKNSALDLKNTVRDVIPIDLKNSAFDLKNSVRDAIPTKTRANNLSVDGDTGTSSSKKGSRHNDDGDSTITNHALKKIKGTQNFSGYVPPQVRNVDEAIFALHTLLSEHSRSPFDASTSVHSQNDYDCDQDEFLLDDDENEYDWILDGDPTDFLAVVSEEKTLDSTLELQSNESMPNQLREIACATLSQQKDDSQAKSSYGKSKAGLEKTHSLPNIIAFPLEQKNLSITEHAKVNFLDPNLLSLLPNDPSTLEGRFTLRIQENSSKTSIAFSLSSTASPSTYVSDEMKSHELFSLDYYEADFDPVLRLIELFPLNTDNYNHSESHKDGDDFQIPTLDTYVNDTLTYLEQKSIKATSDLVDKTNSNAVVFDELIAEANQIEYDISQALLCAKEGTKLVRRSRAKELDASGGGGFLGWETIAIKSQERDSYRLLNSILESVSSIVDVEKEITSFCDTMSVDASTFLSSMPRLPQLIEVCMNFRDQVHNSKELSQILSLSELRKRASKIMQFLCKRLEYNLMEFLSARCEQDKNKYSHEWESETITEYTNILSVRLALEPFVRQESKSSEVPDVSISWINSIKKALVFEVERSVLKALLDPTVVSSNSKDDSTDDASADENTIPLESAVRQLRVGDDDRSPLRTITQSLLKLRFDSQGAKNYLPLVYHQLCFLIADILRLNYVISGWHESTDDTIEAYVRVKANPDYKSSSFVAELKKCHLDLWRHCESTLVDFLDGYLSCILTAKSSLGKDDNRDIAFDDRHWRTNIEGLHDILQLTNQLLLLAKEFVGSSVNVSRPQWPLKDKLCAVFRYYLRELEVEGMNSVGSMFADESWRLTKVSLNVGPFPSEHERVCSSFATYIRNSCSVLSNESAAVGLLTQRVTDNKFKDDHTGARKFLPSFSYDGNPFTFRRLSPQKTARKEQITLQDSLFDGVSEVFESFHHHLLTLYGYKALDFMWATDSSINGLTIWAARLLFVMEKLPIIDNDVIKATCNIFDLYFVFVFRLCAADEANANVMLGTSARSGYIMDESNSLLVENVIKDAPMPSQTIAANSQKKENNLKQTPSSETSVFKFIDADIVAPLRAETTRRTKLQAFIRRGRESRSGLSSLRKYEASMQKKLLIAPTDKLSLLEELKLTSAIFFQRVVASISCLFVACLSHVTLRLMNKSLQSHQSQSVCCEFIRLEDSKTVNANEDESVVLKNYAENVLDMVPLLSELCSRMAAIRVIKCKDIVMTIFKIGIGWNKKSKLHEQSNDYVETLVERISLLWGFMTSSHMKAYPEGILTRTWSLVIESGFLALLEGFSQINSCSTEGRALMSIDLATYSSGINRRSVREKLEMYEEVFGHEINAPPSPILKFGMQYVDMYIKVFYFPLEDVMKWIEKNRGEYYLSQLLALVSCCVSDRIPEKDRQKKLTELAQKVKAL